MSTISISRAMLTRTMMFHRLLVPPIGCQCNHQLQLLRHKKGGRHGVQIPKSSSQNEKWVSKSAAKAAKQSIRKVPNNYYEKFMTKVPETDIWIRTHYPPLKRPVGTAVEMHREMASPEILDNMDGMLICKLELDMKTNKKTKFIGNFNGVLLMPHQFDDGTTNNVLAFCRTKDEKKIAMEYGALFAGGPDLMGQIDSGDIKSYMFDHAVCTFDYIEDITKARKQIKDKFPNKKGGFVKEDLAALVHYFKYGKNYLCEKLTDDFARMTFNIGHLSMPTEHIEANLQAWIDRINFHRSKTISKNAGPFITRAYLMVPPSGEKIHLLDDVLASDEEAGNPLQPTILPPDVFPTHITTESSTNATATL